MKIIDKRTAHFVGIVMSAPATVFLIPPDAVLDGGGTLAFDYPKCTKHEFAEGKSFCIDVLDGYRVALFGDSDLATPITAITDSDTGANVHTVAVDVLNRQSGESFPQQFAATRPLHAGDLLSYQG